LDSAFGDSAFYVHLKRDRDDVAKSFLKRFGYNKSIIDAFCAGIRKTPPHTLDDASKLLACYDYIDTVTANIESFLSDKSDVMHIEIENIRNDFGVFWNHIGAEGSLDDAIKEFEVRHNAS
jgi:hypothetical protein